MIEYSFNHEGAVKILRREIGRINVNPTLLRIVEEILSEGSTTFELRDKLTKLLYVYMEDLDTFLINRARNVVYNEFLYIPKIKGRLKDVEYAEVQHVSLGKGEVLEVPFPIEKFTNLLLNDYMNLCATHPDHLTRKSVHSAYLEAKELILNSKTTLVLYNSVNVKINELISYLCDKPYPTKEPEYMYLKIYYNIIQNLDKYIGSCTENLDVF